MNKYCVKYDSCFNLDFDRVCTEILFMLNEQTLNCEMGLPGCAVSSDDALTCPLVPVGIPAIVRPAPAPTAPPTLPVCAPPGLYLADFVNSRQDRQSVVDTH